MSDFDGFLKNELRGLGLLEARKSYALSDQGVGQQTLVATLFQNANGVARDGFGLLEFFFSNENLCASVVDLSCAYFVSVGPPKSPRLFQVGISFLETRKSENSIANVVLYVRPEYSVASPFEVSVGFFIFPENSFEIIKRFLSRSKFSQYHRELTVVGTFQGMTGDFFE